MSGEKSLVMTKGATLISIQMVILGADLAVCSLSHPERILGINYVNRNIFASCLMEMGLLLITDIACCLGFKQFVFWSPLASVRHLENSWRTTAPFSASPQCQQREQQNSLNFKQTQCSISPGCRKGDKTAQTPTPSTIKMINTSGLHRTTATPEPMTTSSQGVLMETPQRNGNLLIC